MQGFNERLYLLLNLTVQKRDATVILLIYYCDMPDYTNAVFITINPAFMFLHLKL